MGAANTSTLNDAKMRHRIVAETDVANNEASQILGSDSQLHCNLASSSTRLRLTIQTWWFTRHHTKQKAQNEKKGTPFP